MEFKKEFAVFVAVTINLQLIKYLQGQGIIVIIINCKKNFSK